MDYITKFKRQVALRIFLAISVTSFIAVGVAYYLEPQQSVLVIGSFTALVLSIFSTWLLVHSVTKPVVALSDIINYASHSTSNELPNLDSLPIAKELIEGLSRQVYDLASTNPSSQAEKRAQDAHSTANEQLQLIDGLGVPVIGLDANQKITTANKAAADYFSVAIDQFIGKPLYDVVSFSFQGEETLEQWIQTAQQNAVTATRFWERVRQIVNQDTSNQFDLVASFSSGSSTGTDTMLAIFDRSARYNQDDQEISFVALAVHELRTPLTIMRGYIEVFEDELGPTLSPELTDFMHKMHASAQQLTAFVGNILNVARVEENQLSLKLREETIESIIKTAVDDLQLRAKVHGKTIELQLAENLPTVAVDRISIHEVVNNLVDNAIKYSDKAEKIIVKTTLNSDGLVEISVQDFGIGIPASVMPELFKKFHRSHKSRVQVGGTGLGLYLCKALVTAHGGNIWVRSKEGEGSIFSFTILPYDKVKQEQISGEDGIIRGAHGWIKNHSLYRN